MLTRTTEPTAQSIPSARRILARNEKLRGRIERSKILYTTIGGEERIVWKPEVSRVNNVVVKNARGHVFFEYGEPMLTSPSHVGFIPLVALTDTQRDAFENETVEIQAFWPEVGSRMLTRVITGQDLFDSWVIVQDGVYRYTTMQGGGFSVKTVIHEYLATEAQWDI